MSYLSWNCRGLGLPRTIQELKTFLLELKLDVLFLMETKLPAYGMTKLKFGLGYSHCFAVDRRGLSGGLALLWKEHLDLQVQSFSISHIDAKLSNWISGVDGFSLVCMGIRRQANIGTVGSSLGVLVNITVSLSS